MFICSQKHSRLGNLNTMKPVNWLQNNFTKVGQKFDKTKQKGSMTWWVRQAVSTQIILLHKIFILSSCEKFQVITMRINAVITSLDSLCPNYFYILRAGNAISVFEFQIHSLKYCLVISHKILARWSQCTRITFFGLEALPYDTHFLNLPSLAFLEALPYDTHLNLPSLAFDCMYQWGKLSELKN